ncbi:uncharacterized protein [Ptychodera flava]|uniref:uncharacterized protein n=1 Tax=Ptychodera flava TaxID=63121 RepID=UPI003969CB39
MATKQSFQLEIVDAANENRPRTVIQVQKEIADLLKSPNLDSNIKQAILNQAIAAHNGKQKENGKQTSQHSKDGENETQAQQDQVEPTKKTSTENNTNIDKVHIWTDREETLLVVLRSDMEDVFKQSVRHEKLWQSIVSEMEKAGIYVTISQVRDKWKNLKKSYMEVIDNRKKTGGERKTCRHFKEFDNLYGMKESTNPTCTIDSLNLTDTSNKNKDSIVTTVTEMTDMTTTNTADTTQTTASTDATPRKSRKRNKTSDRVSPQDKIIAAISQMEKKNDDLFELMEKQHTEKMKRMDRMLNLYERSLSKN